MLMMTAMMIYNHFCWMFVLVLFFSECISNLEVTQDKDNNDGDEMDETDQETKEQNERESNNRNEQQRISIMSNLGRPKLSSNSFETRESNSIVNMISMEQFGTKMAELRNEIRIMKQHYYNKETTKCYQLKICHKIDTDLAEVIRNFEEREILQPVLDMIKPNKGSMENVGLVGNCAICESVPYNSVW